MTVATTDADLITLIISISIGAVAGGPGAGLGDRNRDGEKTVMNNLETLEANICAADRQLHERLGHAFSVNNDLDRKLVSYQANKTEKYARWCKYKEGFSVSLIRYILKRLSLKGGRILDPFAGSGTTLFTASEFGLDSSGIELLPNAIETMHVRKSVQAVNRDHLSRELVRFEKGLIWRQPGPAKPFMHLAITKGAYPEQTEVELGRFLHEAEQVEDKSVRQVLLFAAMCVLEDISYTRKDGQYLRWDSRSGRQGVGKKPFDKGRILSFTDAINQKLEQIVTDISDEYTLIPDDLLVDKRGEIEVLEGSTLDVLPRLESGSFDGLITSPPYCNRYDYTRTYALELAMLGVDEEALKRLRQTMLSCTVENRNKVDLNNKFSNLYDIAIHAFESQELLQLILSYLDNCLEKHLLNNNGIPRMVRNYFTELTLTIFECARVLKPGAPFVMVNDNVRYQGIPIPVDLILSDIAQQAGFEIDCIWVLPRGKGNSSQQMGVHGRQETRKCVYVWRNQSDVSHVTR